MKKQKQLSFTIYEARLKLSPNDPIKIIGVYPDVYLEQY